MRTFPPAFLVFLALAVPASGSEPPALPAEHVDHVQTLLQGVSEVGVPGVPGSISVFGEDAFPVVLAQVGGQSAPAVAATRLGRGRVVMFAHNGYFGDLFTTADTGRLLVNACRWAAGKTKRGTQSVRVAVRKRGALVPHLKKAGLEAAALDAAEWTRRLKGFDVLCSPVADITEKELKALRSWLKGGGGLLCGLPGWGWQQLNPGKELATENMGNRLLAPAGLVWGDGYASKPAGGLFTTDGLPDPLTHARLALDGLIAASDGTLRLSKAQSALAVATVTRAIRALPPDDKLLLPRLGKLLEDADDPRFLPTAKRPLTDSTGLGKLLLTLQIERGRALPPGEIEAHPAAAHFPGAVPKRAPRVRRSLALDTTVAGWHSTGLYAAPGEVVMVRVPKGAAGASLAIRVGAHKDKLWSKPAWRRAPELTRTYPVTAALTRIAGAFGGLLYVVVPPRCKLGTIQVDVSGAVEAPLYVLGATDLEAWRTSIRKRPGPWAELATSKVVITVPSEHVRDLDDPEALMTWWDGVMDACADLAAIPRERARPERYVTDEQISAGYMHAGYPIMTHLDAAKRFVDLEHLSTNGDWGMFHEMGHNHQRPDWTFGGTGEVTCNLFSLYCMETVCKKGVGHGAMAPEKIAQNKTAHVKAGKTFDVWKSKPFTGLILYYELKQAFGWDAYKQVFAEYRDLADYERPKKDADKRDQWLVRMSKTVGRDLGPFFESWGIPVSKKARETVKDLPAWMPGED